MDHGDGSQKLVDPEVRAFIFSLVSALGGSGAGDDGRYVLGDDALAVLKDIKRWLKLYDDKTNRLDVNRLLAEANIVKGDLLEILAGWPEDAPENSFRSKMSLMCVDLLTQLTWPVEKEEEHTRLDHFLHIPYLRTAQTAYKRAILNHDTNQMLRTVARVALPAMAEEKKERSPMDDNIIKVVLYLFRNIAMITKPDNVLLNEDDNDISRSATIDAFHKQDVYDIILMLCSNMSDDYQNHDVEVMDVIFHLVKGVDVERLFMENNEICSSNTKDLQDLLGREKGMHADYARHAPSRHNRFGTMMWVKRDGGKNSTIVGQSSIATEHLALNEIDKNKKWKRPKGGTRKPNESAAARFDSQVPLTAKARRHLRSFVEKFLDSSFNPLFISARKAIEREADRVLDYHSRQFFFLVSWFLRAEHARRKSEASAKARESKTVIGENFSLVAGVLNQETFVVLNRDMQKSLDEKSWQDLNAQMKCFTQILLTVQEMTESPLDEDQDIAENILSRIFYEQTTHDRITQLLRIYKDQGFGYLDACTELSHVFLRLLERYSKQNVDLHVRTRRRARKKRRAEQAAMGGEQDVDDKVGDNDVADLAEATVTVSERKFEFTKFAGKFISQGSCDTFIALLRYYRELNAEQLKRCHRFFYRAAFKMDLTVYFFRMDIIALFFKLVKGPEGLNSNNPTFKEWEEFSRQLFRRLVKKMEERPALSVELLFSKIPNTLFYLEYGYEKEVTKKAYRPPAELEVKPGMTHTEELGVLVSVLINQNKFDALEWFKSFLSNASFQRKVWEDDFGNRPPSDAQRSGTENKTTIDSEHQPAIATTEGDMTDQPSTADQEPTAPPIYIKADTSERQTTVQRDKHVRLLLTLLGLVPSDSSSEDEQSKTDTTWIIPGSITSTQLREDLDAIKGFEFSPPLYDEGKSPEDFLRRKTNTLSREGQPQRQHNGDESGDESLPSDVDAHLFPAGGPTIKRPSRSPEPRKIRRRRNHHDPDPNIDERVFEERREARRKLQEEKARKIKSALYVHDSDDETDDEADRLFFQKEEERRKDNAKGIIEAVKRAADLEANDSGKRKTMMKPQKKRKNPSTDAESDSASASAGISDNDSDSEVTKPRKRRHVSYDSTPGSNKADDSNDDETMHDAPLTTTNKKAVTTAQTIESDSEQEIHLSSPAGSEAETDQDDTPPTSQRPSSHHSNGIKMNASADRTASTRTPDASDLDSGAMSGSDKENAGMQGKSQMAAATTMPKAWNIRAGFVIESDDDED